VLQVRPDSLWSRAVDVGASLSSSKEEATTDKDKIVLFIDALVGVFWTILTKNSASPIVRPVVNPGFTLVNMTVACLVEVIWCFVLQDHSLLSPVLKHTLKFLFYTVSKSTVLYSIQGMSVLVMSKHAAPV